MNQLSNTDISATTVDSVAIDVHLNKGLKSRSTCANHTYNSEDNVLNYISVVIIMLSPCVSVSHIRQIHTCHAGCILYVIRY